MTTTLSLKFMLWKCMTLYRMSIVLEEKYKHKPDGLFLAVLMDALFVTVLDLERGNPAESYYSPIRTETIWHSP